MNSPYGLYEYGCTLPVIQQDRVVLDPDIELPFYSYQFLPSHEKPFFSEAAAAHIHRPKNIYAYEIKTI